MTGVAPEYLLDILLGGRNAPASTLATGGRERLSKSHDLPVAAMLWTAIVADVLTHDTARWKEPS
ncbi:MAG: hypothetical protein ACR2HQ_12915 [Ilumatobacteraceae bacterium]